MFTFAHKLVITLGVTIAMLVPTVAHANPSAGINPPPGAAYSDASATQNTQSAQPLSLTAVLLDAQAQKQGIDLASLLVTMGPQMETSMGVSGLFAPGDFNIVNTRLAEFSFGDGDYQSLLGSVLGAVNTPDGSAIAASIANVRTMSNLTTPTVTMPGVPGGAALLASAGPDELAFGLFANQALADLVRNQPSVLGQIQAGGTLSPESQGVFNQSLKNAAAATNVSLSGNLLSPCYAGMLATLGSGSSSAAAALGVPADCAPCVAAGTYLHNQMGQMIGGNQFLLDPNDGVMSQYEWSQLDPSSQQAILSLNPQLQNQMSQVAGAGSGQAAAASACSQASAGTTNYLQSRAGDILSRLGG